VTDAVDDERGWLADHAACSSPLIRQITWHQHHRG